MNHWISITGNFNIKLELEQKIDTLLCSDQPHKTILFECIVAMGTIWKHCWHQLEVNSFLNYWCTTHMSVDAPKELKDAWMPLIPAHRMGDPEELVGAVIYLAGDGAGYTNGCDLIIDGAYTCI